MQDSLWNTLHPKSHTKGCIWYDRLLMKSLTFKKETWAVPKSCFLSNNWLIWNIWRPETRCWVAGQVFLQLSFLSSTIFFQWGVEAEMPCKENWKQGSTEQSSVGSSNQWTKGASYSDLKKMLWLLLLCFALGLIVAALEEHSAHN